MPDRFPFDFIFVSPDKVSSDQLMQGDLLRRTPELASAIGQAHSYYAEAEDYIFFLVLTQSCDLVRREGKCKSRYITICAVRPLSVAVSREFEKFTNRVDGFPFPIGDLDRSVLARQYLDRVINNSVDGIFFIPKGSSEGIDSHLCAFLPLSIALRVEHYNSCLMAKVAQVEQIFAAKIGSLASGLYGRVATPDLHEENDKATVTAFKEEFFEELGYGSVAWLSREEKKALKARVKTAVEAGSGEPLSEVAAERLLKDLPNEAEAIANRVIEVLLKRKIILDDEKTLKLAKSYLMNDPRFKSLAKR